MKNSNFKGFTLIETMLVMAIFITLMGIATVSLTKFERNSSISAVVNTIIPDLKTQQIKAMAGDGESGGSISDYGIHFTSSSYTLFRGTYSAGNSSNIVVSMPANITLATSFSGGEVLFTKGSGEISGQNTITFTDTTNGVTKTITINKLGTVTGVN